MNSFPWAALLLIAIVVCFATRRLAIGGWLLFFFYQVWLSAAYSVLTFAGLVQAKNSRLLLQVWLSVGVSALCAVCLLAMSVFLLLKRNHTWVNRLCTLLAVTIAVRGILLLARNLQHQTLSAADLFGVIFLAAYYGYFLRSERVRRVFVTQDWGSAHIESAATLN
jgi:hypothetical protein